MEDKNTRVNEPTKNAMKGYDPTARDFERTEEETDAIDQSEIDFKEEKEKKDLNKSTAEGNTEPNKSNIN